MNALYRELDESQQKMPQSPGDGAELGEEHETCFVEEVDGETVLTPLSLALEIGIPLKPFDGAEE